ncbi:olfactomedin-4 [Trichomycterus rosablanca]|uniref:olfactomedin-4 n=1 Tax=Trichomycterus rosablanca TaxID=2290929 RepID=UPI002F360299
MHRILVLLLIAGPAYAWLPVEEWGSGNVTGSLGEFGQCICKVYLPDTSFPADHVESVQISSNRLTAEVELHIKKVLHFKGELVILLSELSNLTSRVEMLESGPDKYIKLDFELLRVELRQFETLVTHLKASLNSSLPIFDSLYTEIRNMSMTVDQLESYDKSNLEVIRIEFVKLQRKLEKCQDEQEDFSNAAIGSCKHGGILRVGKPVVSQLNADLNSNFKFGGWGKDSEPLPGSEHMYFYYSYSDPLFSRIRVYADYYRLIMRQPIRTHELYINSAKDWRGLGNNYIVRNNTLYYQFRSPFSMGKYDMNKQTAEYRVVPKASNRFSYHYSDSQNLDFAADEKGLYVTYATEESNGKLVLGKINEAAFALEDVWQTSIFKQSVTNAFMVCGILYATRSVDVQTEEIFYAYDTNKRQESYISIKFEKFQDFYVSLDYNPRDQKLYMFNNGYYVSYSVKFKTA